MVKKTKIVILCIVFLLLLPNIILAKETIFLDLNQIVARVFIEPPVTSNFSRFIFGVEKEPTQNILGLVTPNVSFEIRDNLENVHVRSYNCSLTGDLSNFFTIKEYLSYSELLSKKYETKKYDSKEELLLTVVYPYLTILEMNQNLCLIKDIKSEFYTHYNFLKDNWSSLQMDPLLLKQVEVFYDNFNLLMENNHREYESFWNEILFLLGRKGEIDIEFDINDSLESFQEKFSLNSVFSTDELMEIVENHPDVQVADLDLEIERLAERKRFYDMVIPDLNYNLSYNYASNDGELNWSLSADWDIEFGLSKTGITVNANSNSRSFRIDLNHNNDHNGQNQNLVEMNERNVDASRYMVERKYSEIINRIEERDCIMKITQTNIEILSEQIERLRQQDNPANYIQMMKLIYDYVNAKISFNAQYKSYLYSQFQLKLAQGKIKLEDFEKYNHN